MNELIRRILDETNYAENPYFTQLKDGSFEKDDFVETQIQFYFAVVFFSRPMAAVAAKIPSSKQRLEVLRNVWEEHGEGRSSFMHGETFLTYLDRLAGITPKDIGGRALWPEVRAFNTVLVGACVMDEFIVGVGCMGMIERMFCDISRWIGQSTIDRGWLTPEQLIHYNLHEELDVKHSQDFFDVLAPYWEASDDDQYLIEQGLRLGASVFDGMYRGLYRSRKRRASCGGRRDSLLHTRA